MTKKTKIYVTVVSAAGLLLSALCVWDYFLIEKTLARGTNEIISFSILALITIMCRCLPLTVSDGCALDMSFISILTAVLTRGPVSAIVLTVLTTPFVVVSRDGDVVKHRHIFNTPPEKTLFNTANLTLSIAFGGVFYYLCGGVPGQLPLPFSIIPAVVYMASSIVANTAIMFGLFSLQGRVRFFSSLASGIVQMIPNLACTTPIGYFFALLYIQPSGEYLMLLFMLPLWLARYSFQLYLDSKKQQYAIVQTLTAAIEAKDAYTEGHSRRVEEYSVQLARKLRLSESRVENIRLAALFHDVGKIGIPDNVLNKNGPLDDAEWAEIRQHPQISVKILENVRNFKDIRDIVVCHHERYDGHGYPLGRGGEDVPLDAYILGVADAFDAITSDRPYRSGMGIERAEKIIAEEQGRQFHPLVAQAALELISSGELVVDKAI